MPAPPVLVPQHQLLPPSVGVLQLLKLERHRAVGGCNSIPNYGHHDVLPAKPSTQFHPQNELPSLCRPLEKPARPFIQDLQSLTLSCYPP